jgi:NAD(P)-dependent dehydrogenase (short-subunit alcohol dehydrogenase family)
VYVVTGASSGIGRATAAVIADTGADVVAVARSHAELRRLAVEHPSIRPVTADVGTPSGIEALVRAVGSGRVDGIVHAAGSMIEPHDYIELDADTLIDHMRVHVTAPMTIKQRLRSQLRGGRVIAIDSWSADDVRVGWCGYSIVKSAARMAALAARAELDHVTVIRVFPGAVRTPLVESVLSSSRPSPTRDAFRKLDAGGTIANPDDVGRFIADLLLVRSDVELVERPVWDITDQR